MVVRYATWEELATREKAELAAHKEVQELSPKDSRDEQLEVIRVATDRFEGAANYPTESGLNAKRADRMGWKSASSMSS